MFKKTMKFEDLDGNPVEQTFYFNYTRKEVAELMEFGYISQFRPADISKSIPLEKQLEILQTPVEESGLSQQENTQNAYDIFQNLILDAYGRKGADNVTFYKNEELREYWKSHVAFDHMIFEFIANPQVAAQFIEECVPSKFRQEAIAELRKKGEMKPEQVSISQMVEEAERRQQDPATRIEPGIQAAREALGENPAIEQAAQLALVQDDQSPQPSNDEPAKTPGDLTIEDIEAMDDVAFSKLSPLGLQPEVMVAAFKRKNQS